MPLTSAEKFVESPQNKIFAQRMNMMMMEKKKEENDDKDGE